MMSFSENPKSSVRAYFDIDQLDLNFKYTQYMKGLSSFKGVNTGRPGSSKIILERFNNYSEAYNAIEKLENVEPQIVFDLIKQRMDSYEDDIRDLNRLESYGSYKTVKDVQGYYICGYISQTNDFDKKDKLTVGCCQIKSNGLATFKFPHSDYIKAYVSNGVYHGPKTISLRNFIYPGQDTLKFRYDLKIIHDFSSEFYIPYLTGVFSGFFLSDPYAGPIVFIRISDLTDITESVTKKFVTVDEPNNPQSTYGQKLMELLKLPAKEISER